jgi:hypothetical protein
VPADVAAIIHPSQKETLRVENGSKHGVLRYRFFCVPVKPARLKILPNVLAAGHTTSGCSISNLALSFRAWQDDEFTNAASAPQVEAISGIHPDFLYSACCWMTVRQSQCVAVSDQNATTRDSQEIVSSEMSRMFR